MRIVITVCADNEKREKKIATELAVAFPSAIGKFEVNCGSDVRELGHAVFIDHSIKNLDRFLEKIDRRGRALFLIVEDNSTNQVGLPPQLEDGRVDDVVISPFRPLELLSKIRQYEQILMWSEVAEINASISDLTVRLQEDLKLAERLQKSKIPKRFPNVKGFKVDSRYFAGLRPGGDFFDIAESKDKSHLSMILSHSTSYGLSSAVLTALMRVTLKLTLESIGKDGAISEVVRQVKDELSLTLREQDKLSLFYGTYHIRNRVLRYLNLGEALVFYANPEKSFESLPQHGRAISIDSPAEPRTESIIQLEPTGRLAFLSYGIVESLGGREKMHEILNRFRQIPPADLLNELSYRMKSKLTEGMPSQDCTMMILDVDTHVLQMTRREQVES